MNRTPVVAVAFILTIGVTTPARAQIDLTKRVSVGLEKVAPARLFQSMAELNRFQVTVDPLLQRPITITLEDVTLETLFTAACDSLECRWRVEGNRLVVEALPPDPARRKTSIEPPGEVMAPGTRFSNTPVRSVLAAIGHVAGGACEIQEVDAAQSITVDLGNLDVIRALVAVARATGMRQGTPLTLVLRKPQQKPVIIHTSIPRRAEVDPGLNETTVTVGDFKPPLSAGKQRKYDRSPEAVSAAVRDAMRSGHFQLLSEQPVGAVRVFEAMTRSIRNMQSRDKVRIVVDPISRTQTAVRVTWPAAGGFVPDATAESLYFRAIESRLK